MDWAKAKSILIILFVGLNIFLLINLISFYRSDIVSNKNINNTVKILKDRGYILKCKIPANIRAQMLDYENGVYNYINIARRLLGEENFDLSKVEEGQKITSGSKSLEFEPGNVVSFVDESPSQTIDISDMKGVQKHTAAFLKDLDLPVSGYHLSAFRRNDDNSATLIYNGSYKKYLIYYNKIKVNVSSKGITSLQFKLIKPKHISSQNNKIVPAYKVLLKNFTKGQNTEITSIDLGFVCSYHDKSAQASEGLVWRIVTDNREAMYYNAATADIINTREIFTDD